MSRDPRTPHGAELLTAYVDGVAELPPDERHVAQAHLERDPGARAEADAARALLDRLRALPPEGGEPDWAAMERSIRQAVAAPPPRPWWRRWPWLVPAMTCAAAATVLLMLWPRAAPRPTPEPPRPPGAEHPAPGAPEPADEASVVALWLDGSEVDVDVSAPVALGDMGPGPSSQASQPSQVPIDPPDEVGLLPATDLAWVDTLDDAALDRVERWLDHPEDAAGPHRGLDVPSPPGKRQGTQENRANQEKKI